MTTLPDGTTPPDAFLAQRLAILIIASDREFRGSTVPLPEMPDWPGLFRAMPVNVLDANKRAAQLEAHREANRRFREAHHEPRKRSKGQQNRSLATGEIPMGATVNGLTVIGFMPPWSKPTDFMPAGTPTYLQGGHHPHFPVSFARYCVAVVKGGKTHYQFPKATSLEREYRSQGSAPIPGSITLSLNPSAA